MTFRGRGLVKINKAHLDGVYAVNTYVECCVCRKENGFGFFFVKLALPVTNLTLQVANLVVEPLILILIECFEGFSKLFL